jgi:simple sugar transport system substrate-binding protein
VRVARRGAVLLGVVALVAVLAGCGGTKAVREPDLRVAGAKPGAPGPGGLPGGARGVRIAVVTHGQASSPFWAIIRNGVETAARQMDVLVSYRAPDIYSLDRMKALIDQAVASKPDGLVVSIPEPGLGPAIKRAIKAGIPVVSINSGSDVAAKLGVLAHVGQAEEQAGFDAGKRLAAAGVRRAFCVNQQVGNVGLDARCRGLARAMRQAGGRARVFPVDDQSTDTPRKLAAAIDTERIEGVLTLNSTTGGEAVTAARLAGRAGKLVIGTFDLGPEVLTAVKDGQIRFAVDQQAYLQGYLPIVLLAERARYGLFPAHAGVIATGPNFVTKANAARVIGLSRRSIR